MIAVCIPSIGKSGPMLPALVEACRAEHVDVLEVWDNQDMCPPMLNAEMVRAPGLTIYQEFNEFAREYNDTYDLAILNDDIVLLPGSLGKLEAALNEGFGLISGTDQRYGSGTRETQGTIRRGGIRSWAFMVARGCWPEGGIDERFRVWYGDDDLLWKMGREGQRIGVHEGVYVEHRHSTTIHQLDWVPEAQAADSALWASLGRP